MKRDKVAKTARLSSCKNFVSEREKFIFDAFVDLQPVERFENGSDMSGFRSLARARDVNALKFTQMAANRQAALNTVKHEGRSINKLQKDIILLILKI